MEEWRRAWESTEGVLPIAVFLFILQCSYQINQGIFHFVVKFIQLVEGLGRDLAGLLETLTTRVEFAAGTEGYVQMIQIFFDSATAVSFCNIP